MIRAALLLSCLGLLGCKNGDSEATPKAPDDAALAEDARDATAEVVHLERVAIETVDPDEPRELYTRQLGKKLGLQLSRTPEFSSEAAPPPDDARVRPAALTLSITYDVLDDGPEGKPAVVAAVEAELAWLDDGYDLAPGARVVTHRDLEPEERNQLDGIVAAHVARTVSTIGDELIAKERLRTAPEDDVVAALDAADPERVLWALEIVADRALDSAFDEAVELLDSKQVPVRDAAVSALVALGDPRAVEVLADRPDYKDRDFLLSIIEAVSTLGGEDAEQFLEFMTSHHDEDIRRRAGEALERVRRKAPTSSP